MDALAASTAYSEIILALKNATDAAYLAKTVCLNILNILIF